MRFVQFSRGFETQERLGILSPDGASLTEISGGACVPSNMVKFLNKNCSILSIQERLKNLKAETISRRHTLLTPVINPTKIIGVVFNYTDLCQEKNMVPPVEPSFFNKFPSTLVPHNGNVMAHVSPNPLDWGVQLAVIIGKEAKHITGQEEAMDCVFGYTIAQDITIHNWVCDHAGQLFLLGKNVDSSCPLGPAIVHKSLIKDPYKLDIRTMVNRVEKQVGNTKNMIYKIHDIIISLTRCITLMPGDVILTGTPGGLGSLREPPEQLIAGDVIESEIESIGVLINKVV